MMFSNILQYNEYYPFGLQTANSWTRENTTGNNFLGNGGTELNTTSNLYDLDFRNYDPILGRMNGVDPMATKYASLSPYNFSFNDPVAFTDVSGADPFDNCYVCNPDYILTANRFGNNVGMRNDIIMDPGGRTNNYGMLHSAFAAADAYFQDRGILNALEKLFPDATFGRGGMNGFWIKTTGVNTATEGLKWGGAIMLGEVLNRNIYVSNVSQNHFNTMMNPIVQRMHEGSREFAAHPFGGALLAFVSGGGLMGAGGGALVNLGARQLITNGARAATQLTMRVGTQAVKNFVKSGLRNAAIDASTQLIFNGGSFEEMDIMDVAISSVSGNSFVLSGIAGGFFDLSGKKGFETGFDKGFYKTSIDIGTGVFFGGANHVTGMIPGSKNIGSKLGFGLDFTIDTYGGLFNYTLTQKP